MWRRSLSTSYYRCFGCRSSGPKVTGQVIFFIYFFPGSRHVASKVLNKQKHDSVTALKTNQQSKPVPVAFLTGNITHITNWRTCKHRPGQMSFLMCLSVDFHWRNWTKSVFCYLLFNKIKWQAHTEAAELRLSQAFRKTFLQFSIKLYKSSPACWQANTPVRIPQTYQYQTFLLLAVCWIWNCTCYLLKPFALLYASIIFFFLHNPSLILYLFVFLLLHFLKSLLHIKFCTTSHYKAFIMGPWYFQAILL